MCGSERGQAGNHKSSRKYDNLLAAAPVRPGSATTQLIGAAGTHTHTPRRRHCTMVDQAQHRIQEAMTALVDDLDKTYLRGMQVGGLASRAKPPGP